MKTFTAYDNTSNTYKVFDWHVHVRLKLKTFSFDKDDKASADHQYLLVLGVRSMDLCNGHPSSGSSHLLRSRCGSIDHIHPYSRLLKTWLHHVPGCTVQLHTNTCQKDKNGIILYLMLYFILLHPWKVVNILSLTHHALGGINKNSI